MPKFHEIIAIDGDVRKVYKKLKDEIIHVFLKKPNLFKGTLRQVKNAR